MVNENNDIHIEKVEKEKILLKVNGQNREIFKKLDALQELLKQLDTERFQTANKIYNIQSINQASFSVVMDSVGTEKPLPLGLAENLITAQNIWIQSLKEELQEQPNISVGNKPGRIFHHYGWLIETFLLKMASKVAHKDPLRRLSFMTEAYQSSLRYLSYIQLAQLISSSKQESFQDFFQLDAQQFHRFDFLNLLFRTSSLIPTEDYFIFQMKGLVQELFDPTSELYETVIFLEQQRSALINKTIGSVDSLDLVLDQYLTALVYWLRSLSFLAQYRLVSIKDINLSYQLGTPKNFVHTYGELHGMYDERASDFDTRSLQDVFTYSRSVLLFKGSSIEVCLNQIDKASNYLSLSPLIIDQSVFTDKETQTPEIYYYIGQGGRQYQYAQYRNELSMKGNVSKRSNKFISIKRQNTQQPRWNKLYKQIDQIFSATNLSGV